MTKKRPRDADTSGGTAQEVSAPMQQQRTHEVSGHVFQIKRKRGPIWYAKYRLPDGRQVQRKVGPHWSDRSPPAPDRYFPKTTAKAWLDDVLAQARRGELPGQVRTGSSFDAACEEWLAYKADRSTK